MRRLCGRLVDFNSFSGSNHYFEWERAENEASTYDFESFGYRKAAAMPPFSKNLKLKEMIKLTPEEYINNLLMNGAEEQK